MTNDRNRSGPAGTQLMPQPPPPAAGGPDAPTQVSPPQATLPMAPGAATPAQATVASDPPNFPAQAPPYAQPPMVPVLARVAPLAQPGTPFGSISGPSQGSHAGLLARKVQSPIVQRIPGALLLIVGFSIVGVNSALIVIEGEFYPKLMIVALPAIWGGLWVVVFGRPVDRSTLSRPVWWLLGLYGGMFLGLIAGIVAAFALSA